MMQVQKYVIGLDMEQRPGTLFLDRTRSQEVLLDILSNSRQEWKCHLTALNFIQY